MVDTFEIIEKPEVCQFSENLGKMIIRNKNSSLTCVYITVRLDDVTICDKLTLYYDAESLITINLRDIVHTLLECEFPRQTGVTNFTYLYITLTDTATTKTYRFQVIAGGVAAPRKVGLDWWARNFLTWQGQIVTMPAWQPQWLSVVKLNRDPQFLRIKSRLYTAEGIERTQDIFTASEEGIVRINVSFELLWRNICVSEELTPIAYDIYGLGADSISEPDTAGAKNYPFAQRYILRSGNFRDRCFLFQNSLGGFDTIIASGLSTLLPEGEVDTFINQGREAELSNDYTSIWQQNTGYISSSSIARQWQEFLHSSNRYLYADGEWKQIIVTEYEVKHKEAALNSYTFKYHLSEKDEGNYYDRAELPEPELPTDFWQIPSIRRE